LISGCYNEAYRLLEENKDILDRISEYLFEKETITGKEFMKMFREMKGLPEPEEEKDNDNLFVDEGVVVPEENEASTVSGTELEVQDEDYFEED